MGIVAGFNAVLCPQKLQKIEFYLELFLLDQMLGDVDIKNAHHLSDWALLASEAVYLD